MKLECPDREGIIEPVVFSDCTATVVPVMKSNNTSFQLSGDFKLTVIKTSKHDKYPIRTIEELFSTLKREKSFTKLDMSQTYQQHVFNDKSCKYVVIILIMVCFVTIGCQLECLQLLESSSE